MGYPRNLSVFAENVSSQGVLTVAGGGTGATTLGGVRVAIGAAASGVNSDITSITGLTTPLSVVQGGTGTTSLSGLRTTIGAAASGANSDITSISGLTTPLSTAQGGTGLTSLTGLVFKDANNNITANYFYSAYVNSAAAGTITTLTAASAFNYAVSGSGGQTFKLPDATTLPSGAVYTFNNNQSSGSIVVQNNSSTTVVTVQSGSIVYVTLLSNSIAAGSWDNHYGLPSNVNWSTNTLAWTGSITNATWNGAAVGALYGGTGLTSPGASGNVLTSNGSAWVSQAASGVTLATVFAIAAAL